MLRNFNNTLRNPFFLGIFILILLLTFSLNLRQQDFKKVPGSQNLEATYHVLLTVSALNESPAKNHWFLPTVSLGKESDKHIPWGLAAPTKTGDYIYTSFTPPGFLTPYFVFKAFDLEPSVKNLARFNFVLGSLSAFTLFLLLVGLLKFNGYGPWISVGGALAGSTIGIFSREALLSHGVIYWSHSLYQPILIFSLYLIFRYLISETKENRLLYAKAMIVAAFVGPLTEWTGYVFNAGLILLLLLNSRDSASSRTLALQLFIATATAGVLTVVHFSLAVGFLPTILSFAARFIVRSTSTGSIVGLVQGYGLSYGLFILTILPILALAYFGNRQQVTGNRQQVTFFIFAAASIPLLENIAMLQHATQFTFDRLKFIFPASLILAFSFARFDIKGRVVLLVLILLSSFHGYKSYKEDMSRYSSWGSIDAENRKFASRLSDVVDVGCSVFYSNMAARGYANLLFHRGIYPEKSAQWITELKAKKHHVCPPKADVSEVDIGYCAVSPSNLGLRDYAKLLIHHGAYNYKALQETSELSAISNACASVYLEGTTPYLEDTLELFTDLPKYTKAIITYKDGSIVTISSEAIK